MKKISGLIIVIFALIFTFPVFTAVFLSFTDRNADFLQITAGGYYELILTCFSFYPMFWNTLLYASVISIAQLFIMIPCAFGFYAARFKLKNILFIVYVILMMMPLQVTLLPNYIGLRDMGLLDNRLAVIVPMIFMPFGVIVLHQYMKSINFNLIEAIQLETNSVIKILSAAVIPQLKPCIIAVSVYTFADCWNMVEQPMVFLSDINKKTLSLFFTRTTDYNATVFFPAVVIYLLPVFLIFLCSNKSLESGLAFGELHG